MAFLMLVCTTRRTFVALAWPSLSSKNSRGAGAPAVSSGRARGEGGELAQLFAGVVRQRGLRELPDELLPGTAGLLRGAQPLPGDLPGPEQRTGGGRGRAVFPHAFAECLEGGMAVARFGQPASQAEADPRREIQLREPLGVLEVGVDRLALLLAADQGFEPFPGQLAGFRVIVEAQPGLDERGPHDRIARSK